MYAYIQEHASNPVDNFYLGLKGHKSSHIKKSGQIFSVNMDSFVIRAAKPYLATTGATVK